MKKILLIALFAIQHNIMLFGALNSTHWKTIAIDIARDGDKKSRMEFEASRQAFLHIKDETEARIAARAIQAKWKAAFGIEATVGSCDKERTLMGLIRYPMMTKEQALEATKKLLNNSTVAQFFDEQNLKVISPS